MSDFMWRQHSSVAHKWDLQIDLGSTGFRFYLCTKHRTLNFIASFLICIKELYKMTMHRACPLTSLEVCIGERRKGGVVVV